MEDAVKKDFFPSVMETRGSPRSVPYAPECAGKTLALDPGNHAGDVRAGEQTYRADTNRDLAESGQGRSARPALVPCRSHNQRPAGCVKLARATFHGAIARCHREPACRVNSSRSVRILHFFPQR